MTAETKPITILDFTAKSLAVVGASSLAASLTYDWGFFNALNLTFLEVPSAISDHVRSSLLWFPKFAMLGLATLVYELLSQRIEGGRTEVEIINESHDPEKVRKLRRRPYPYVAGAALLPVVGYILIGEPFLQGLSLGIMVAWVLFATWAQSPSRTQSRRPRSLRNFLVFAPPILIYLFITRHVDAAKISEQGAPTSRLYKIDGGEEQIVIARIFDRGVLLKNRTGIVAFVPWRDVKRLELPGTYKKASGLLCSTFSAACAPNSSASAARK